MNVLIKSFKALPIDTIECLEKTINLVFEKVCSVPFPYFITILFLYHLTIYPSILLPTLNQSI